MNKRITNQIRLYPCLSVSDFENVPKNLGYPIEYIHHFIPHSTKLDWHPNYRINICYIPTTFDIHIFSQGPEPSGDMYNNSHTIIKLLATAQQFPGEFCEAELFRELLKSLELNHTKMFKDNNLIQESLNLNSENIKDELDGKRIKLEYTSFNVDKLICPYVKIPGTIIKCFTHNFKNENEPTKLYLTEISSCIFTENEVDFMIVHRRIEWMMHFYIDSLSPIEPDPRWRIFILIKAPNCYNKNDGVEELICLSEQPGNNSTGEKSCLSTDLLMNSNIPFEIIGIITCFQYFSIPKDRLRLSQFFILPNYQNQQLGKSFLMEFMEYISKDRKLINVSVELPSPTFQKMRTVVSIIRAINHKILNFQSFYPKEEYGVDINSIISDENWINYRNAFKSILYESPAQCLQIKWLLLCASRIPSALTEKFDISTLTEFAETDEELRNFRAEVEEKLKIEDTDTLIVKETQQQNNDIWLNTYHSLCTILQSVRKALVKYNTMTAEK